MGFKRPHLVVICTKNPAIRNYLIQEIEVTDIPREHRVAMLHCLKEDKSAV